MQRFLLTLAILILNFINLHGQWEVLNEGINGWLNSVDFVNKDIGWIAGGDGLLLKTNDGGLTWNVIPVKDELYIEKIDFINESIGWAYGWAEDIERYVILKTEDGGYNWIVKRQENDEWYYNIQALNDSIVFLYSDLQIIKTVDGGLEWIDISPQILNGYFRSARFQDKDKGMVSGTVDESGQYHVFIARTYNGGSTWETDDLTEFNEIYDLQFSDDSVGYFLAVNWEEEYESFFFRTQNLGETWELIYQSNYGIDTYFLPSHQNLYLAAFDSLNNNNLMSSLDDGKNWEKIFSLINWQIPYVLLNEENRGLIICNLPGGFRGGSIFLILKNLFNDDIWLTRRFSYPFNDVFFIDQNRGFTVGGYNIFHGPNGGDMFTTNDGGVTWSPDTSISGFINSCEFVNESIGYIMTSDWPWLVFKTADSGLNWKLIYENNYDSSGFEFYGNDMSLSSAEVAWAAGNYWSEEFSGAGIFRTIDGGLTWELYWTYPNTEVSWYNFYSVHVVEDVVWAVGDQGFIARIVDKDSFQVSTYPADLPLNEVYFSDANHGWIAGGYGYGDDFQPLLLKTIDGGITWNKQENSPYIVNELFFRDSLQGWAVGFDDNEEGVILATNNGGASWAVQVDHLIGPLNAIHFIGDYGWAVGELGQVLKTENGGASWIDERNKKVYAATFRLEQNYPNPFNPSTMISYQLPMISDVELSVYNLLGQKVKTLVSQEQPAGYYKIEWDASDYASGVYIYRLKATSKTQSVVKTKKLVLLK